MNRLKSNISPTGLILRGMTIGIAEVIPGVSGGTIALITGIYYRLLSSIKGITSVLVNPSLLLQPSALWKKIDGGFLVCLIGGMLIGMLSGVFGVTYLLKYFPEPLWALFLGLIIASIIYLLGQHKPTDIKGITAIIIGTVIAFGIVQITPAQGAASLPLIFVAGMIAISALLLPGISGSFMLLLMGLYSVVIPAVKDVISFNDFTKLPIVVTFAFGCLLGISVFSRLIHYFLANHTRMTMALLIGFMIGSLYKLWPWRNPYRVMDKDTNEVIVLSASDFNLVQLQDLRILAEQNVMPGSYWGQDHLMLSLVAFVIGISSVWLMTRGKSIH